MNAPFAAEVEGKVNAEVAAARPARTRILPREEAFQIPDLIREAGRTRVIGHESKGRINKRLCWITSPNAFQIRCQSRGFSRFFRLKARFRSVI